MRVFLLAFAAIAVAACDVQSNLVDGGSQPVDSGAIDGGAIDGGAIDAGEIDSGKTDAGPSCISSDANLDGGALFNLCNAGICAPIFRFAGTDAGSARTFANVLSRIANADAGVAHLSCFSFTGVWLATPQELSRNGVESRHIGGPISPQVLDPLREAFEVRTRPGGVLVIGSNENAITNATWHLLRRLGYRQYFPGALWEHVPSTPNVTVSWTFVHVPPWRMRSWNPGYGLWSVATSGVDMSVDWNDWRLKNGLERSETITPSHIYQTFIARIPEFSTTDAGWRPVLADGGMTQQLCVLAPGLKERVLAYQRSVLSTTPALQSVSMEPSDGDGWFSCSAAENAMSISDRTVFLANYVANGLATSHPGVRIGMYSYNSHTAPPSLRVASNIVVLNSTSFVQPPFTYETASAGWRDAGATTGVRDYLCAVANRDLPNASKAARHVELLDAVRGYTQEGQQYYLAESCDSWGPEGIGYFRLAMELYEGEGFNAAHSSDELVSNLFGPVAPEMRSFYSLLHGGSARLISSDLLHRLYEQLQLALSRTMIPLYRERVQQLVLYVGYVELYTRYNASSGAARQSAFETLIQYAYRIRQSRMIHSLLLYRDLDARDNTVSIPPDAGLGWNDRPAINRWKQDAGTLSDSEITQLLADGIANNAVATFQPVAFGSILATARLDAGAAQISNHYLRSEATLRTYRPAPGPFAVQVETSWIAKSNAVLPLEVTVSADDSPTPPDFQLDADAGLRSTWLPDGGSVPKMVCLCARFAGVQTVEFSDRAHGGFRVTTPRGDRWVYELDPSKPFPFFAGRWSMYFYVPKGSRTVGLYSGGADSIVQYSADAGSFAAASLLDGGTLSSGKPPGFYEFVVPAGADGKPWRFVGAGGSKLLMTTPVQVALAADELLLPTEVVATDGLRVSAPVVSPTPPECATACD
jgi:hypothetical protein